MTTETMDPGRSEPVLRVDKLCKTFRSRTTSREALIDVTFSLQPGSCLAVVGESGSGKTTAARIVAGLESATSGHVQLAGAKAGGPTGEKAGGKTGGRAGGGVQMVFQDPFGSLDPRQSVGSGLQELLRIRGHRDRADRVERVSRLLSDVGLDERHAKQYPASLSGGQRQRVAIARALSLDPALLILDEAVSALDVSVQAQVLNLLSDIREQRDIAYLFVSHDLGVVRQVSDTCLVLQQGRVVEQGPTSEVLDSPQQLYTRSLLDAVPRPGWRPSRRPA